MCIILRVGTDTRVTGTRCRLAVHAIGLVLVAVPLAVSRPAAAQGWDGSLRLDYQNMERGQGGSERVGTLTQQYYLRYYNRLFYKNDLTFNASFAYRTGAAGQPVDFRPRYEWQLAGYGYGGRVSYEPYTIRRGMESDREIVRRWRSSVFIQPVHGPRFTYDFMRGRQERPLLGTARDQWNSYSLSWGPAGVALAAGYSRQVRTARDTTAQALEVYRFSVAADRALPWRHRLNVGYNFDRSWDHRPAAGTGEQDQHVPTASLSGQPVDAVNWTAQYSSRFLHRRSPRAGENVHANDQLASGAVTVTPLRPLSLSVSRYIEDSEERQDQPARRSDYWQGRLSTEGRFYRQIRALASVYRLYYTGAPRGRKYSDAYFAALRGRPHRHAEWSTELAFADRHGTQPERYSGNLSTYARLYPTAQTQCQLGYTTLATAVQLDDFALTEESFNANAQYTPDANLSLSGGVTLRRNRRMSARWDPGWTATGTYRWPSFANIGFNYSRRELATAAGTAVAASGRGAAETLLADLLVWLGQRTTATVNYTHRSGAGGSSGSIWGVGFSTQF